MQPNIFDDLTDVYEAMIDWPKRLANEEPFYRTLVERLGVKRVLDVACGTGRHAAMFHSWGLEVEAADISAGMIQRAKESLGSPERLAWVVRRFDFPAAAAAFDLAICVGNSLPLAPDRGTAKQAIRHMLAAVRPGGVIVVHVLNLWQLPDGPSLWQKCQRAALPQGDVLILKGVHRAGDNGYVELVLIDPATNTIVKTASNRFLGLEASELEEAARAAGARRVEFFGDYHQHPYEREKSTDLLMVAER